MFTRCEIKCCICGGSMDWMRGYGRDQRCCGRECHQEFDWRRTLASLGKDYYPDPKRATDAK